MKRLLPVEVEWIDSVATPGWHQDAKPSNQPQRCRTVGYMLKRDRKALTMAQSLDEAGSSGDWMTIPASCVRRVRRLK